MLRIWASTFSAMTASNMTFVKNAWINKNPAVIRLTSSGSHMTRFRSWSKQPTMKFEDMLNGNWRSIQSTTRRGAEISELVVSRSAQRHLHEDSSRNHHSSRNTRRDLTQSQRHVSFGKTLHWFYKDNIECQGDRERFNGSAGKSGHSIYGKDGEDRKSKAQKKS